MKRYRLTESKLRGMIREAVKGMLSELDWKTYMNAANKSYERGPMFQTYADPNEQPNRNERSRRFAKAAEDALNRDYGYKKSYKSGNTGELRFTTGHNRPDYQYDDQMGNPYADKAHFVASKDYADGGHLAIVGPRNRWDSDHSFVEYPDENSSWGYRCGEYRPNSDIYKGDTKYRDAINKGNAELKHYHNNDYEYQKGKGWQLKDQNESINRKIDRIVRESLRRNLH